MIVEENTEVVPVDEFVVSRSCIWEKKRHTGLLKRKYPRSEFRNVYYV